MYLTLRSYRTLTSLQLRDELDDQLMDNTNEHFEATEGPHKINCSNNLVQQVDQKATISGCPCEFDSNLDLESTPLAIIAELDGLHEGQSLFRCFGGTNIKRSDSVINRGTCYPLYPAHNHTADYNFLNTTATEANQADLEWNDRQLQRDWKYTQDEQSNPGPELSKPLLNSKQIVMVENPLNKALGNY